MAHAASNDQLSLVHICRYSTRVMPDPRQVQGVGISDLDEKAMPTPT